MRGRLNFPNNSKYNKQKKMGISRNATIKEIASLAKVHFSTVSRALNEQTRSKVSPEVQERITWAVAKTGYRKNQIATQLRYGLRDLALVVCQDEKIFTSQNILYKDLIGQIQVLLGLRGRHLIYHHYTENRNLHLEKNIDPARYSGLIVLGGDGAPPIDALTQKIPVLQIFRRRTLGHYHHLLHDDAQLAQLALQYLANRGKKNIRLAVKKNDSLLEGRARILIKSAKNFPGIRLQLFAYTGESMEGRDFPKELARGVDTVYALSGDGGRIYVRLLQAGIRVPQDISFIAHDHIPGSRSLLREMTTVGIEMPRVAEAIDDFFAMPKKQKVVKVPGTLFEGQSVS